MLVLYLVPIFFIAQSKTYIPDTEFIAFSHAEVDNANLRENTNKYGEVTKTTEKKVSSETTTVETTTVEATTEEATSTDNPVKRDRETRRNARKEKKRKEKERIEIVTETDEVIFFPNDYVPETYRDVPPIPAEDDGYLANDEKANNDENEDDVFIGRPYGERWDAGKADEDVKIGTDPLRNDDTIFIPKKNKEAVAKEKKAAVAKKKPRVNCRRLVCDVTQDAVCGMRKDEGKQKYRLFKNECFMDKVNCGFKYQDNKYIIIPLSNCSDVGSHRSQPPFSDGPAMPFRPPKLNPVILDTRRSSASRRSNTLKDDGTFCDHLCPISCPELYEPECAVSSTGTRMVFVNHCKLDFHSCIHNVVWYRRPLVECVGAEKTSQRNNRGFIGWMQRIGLIDGNGKFITE